MTYITENYKIERILLRRVSAERPLGQNLCRLVKKNKSAIHGHLYTKQI